MSTIIDQVFNEKCAIFILSSFSSSFAFKNENYLHDFCLFETTYEYKIACSILTIYLTKAHLLDNVYARLEYMRIRMLPVDINQLAIKTAKRSNSKTEIKQLNSSRHRTIKWDTIRKADTTRAGVAARRRESRTEKVNSSFHSYFGLDSSLLYRYHR